MLIWHDFSSVCQDLLGQYWTVFINDSNHWRICELSGSALLHVMTCRLFGAKPLPEPILFYRQLYPQETFTWNFMKNWDIFIEWNSASSSTKCDHLNKQISLNVYINPKPLQWRHNGCDGVSDQQPHDCLPNRLFRCRSKKTPKLRATGLCAENSPVTGQFPAQMACNAENVSIWWRHHSYGVLFQYHPRLRKSSMTRQDWVAHIYAPAN